MGNYLNGYQYPQVIIQHLDSSQIEETIDFDLCNEGGLTESYEEDFKRNKLEKESRFIDFDFKAARIKFTLDYSQYAKKANLMKIEKIFFYHSKPDSYKLLLRPRADVKKRVFEVRLETASYELGIMKGGLNTRGHRLPVITFITTKPVGKNFLDPDTLSKPLFKFYTQ